MFHRFMCLWNLWRKRVPWLFQFTMRARTSLGALFGYSTVLMVLELRHL